MFKESKKATEDGMLRQFVRSEFEPQFEAIVRTRPRIALPSPEQLEIEVLNLVSTIEMTSVELGAAPDGNSAGQCTTVASPVTLES